MKKKCIIGKLNALNEASNKFVVKKLKDEQIAILQNHSMLFEILPEDGSKLLFNEIASIWKISKSSLSDIINKYESQGLINKCVCSEDKRSAYISLTTEGLCIKKKLKTMDKEFLEILLKDFDEEQRKVFEDNMDKALNNIIKML
ncbi:MarR family winged helix-turn-helix transcriptional regulator [Clostridium saccharoperbutylacetonicum]|uniref:Transcriptional regulator n=1 Tax=Clostridium saccharoperbutylacetonicum N1-4(HMT) TaxID=931276 RepID=M1MRT5_9CLOT|nr:MarR family transcriptional regulator [Clostridium saccharoperbutylacetonicum]AGF54277.1 transcriptional regulator [Clostridium saccharoperbutylacetonicum N1-4(HMT)]AQR93194.1 transcriptional regulator SlyA [Clostridium saccharoperbutylacetonicum]NRT59207.1 DNA-binding MarR family transcriptional regulator [Clostridium saccharoperbutylacetonicum]NSB28396.1 DNA-binding MarR family transcriptional regulator [Clostridium saccharoperbutylacetonicum]NSB34611.1 DNA-binding MarR family transcripti